MKLIIDIPEDYYEIIKHHVGNHQLDYRPFEIIANGTPLDDVKAEMEEMRIKFMEHGGVYEHSAYGLDYAIALLNDIGKAESETN